MSNVQPVPNCPKCNTRGQVEKTGTIILRMTCPECKYKWQTLSEICPDCGEPNGYPGPGPCKKCYQVRKKVG